MYIERAKAIHAVEKKLSDARENCLFQVTNYLSIAKALLRAIPAAAVQPIVEGASHDGEQDVAPVVRCSKCIFGCYYEESESWHCRSINGLYREVKENDFCSYGERRTKNVQETEKEIHEVSDPH